MAREPAFWVPRLKVPQFMEPTFWVPWIKYLVPLGTTTSCLGNHDIMLGEPLVQEPLQHLSQRTIVEEPSERTLFNVHTIKDKP